ncbi:ligase-associated DNA damage response endonuclease PdeM [Ignavibacteriales bacterium]
MINDLPQISIEGSTFIALPQKALYWLEEFTLLLSDIHFGKTASFRAAGIAIPEGSTTDDLKRLSDAIELTDAKRIIFLGDLLHHRTGKTRLITTQLKSWIEERPDREFVLITGNHDKSSDGIPEIPQISVFDELIIRNKFLLRHHPEPQKGFFVICGHLHPAIRLRGTGRDSLRLGCTHFSKNMAVLQAFGSFTGTSIVRPEPGDTVFMAHDGEVFSVKY